MDIAPGTSSYSRTALDGTLRQHHRLVLHHLELLIESIDDNNMSALERAQALQHMLSHTPPTAVLWPGPPSAPNAPMRVFEIAELADGIFLHLGLLDLMRLQRVSSRMLAVIKDSDIAQRRLFRQPDPDCDFNMLDRHIERCVPGVPTWGFGSLPAMASLSAPFVDDMETLMNDVALEELGFRPRPLRRISFVVEFRASDITDPEIQLPESLRALYLCQPPIKSLTVRPLCECRGSRKSGGVVVKSDQGFTLGEVLDAAHRRHAVHRLCPQANIRDHDSHGNVRVGFVFEAYLELRPSDPLTGIWAAQVEREESDGAVVAAKLALFGAYLRSKKYCKLATSGNGTQKKKQPTPTFKKWQNAHMNIIADAEKLQAERQAKRSLSVIHGQEVL